MTRMRPLTRAEVPLEVQALYDQMVATRGRVVNSASVYAHCPPVLRAHLRLGESFAASNQVSEALRKLVNLRVAQIVGCSS